MCFIKIFLVVTAKITFRDNSILHALIVPLHIESVYEIYSGFVLKDTVFNILDVMNRDPTQSDIPSSVVCLWELWIF